MNIEKAKSLWKHTPSAVKLLLPIIVIIVIALSWREGKANSADEFFYDGMVYLKSGDYLRAAECLSQAAELGHSEAQYFLGGMYQYGEGVEQDYAKAREYYN